MISKFKYYFFYFINLINRGLADFFLNRNRFREFTSFTNSYKINFELKIKSSAINQIDLEKIFNSKTKKIDVTLEDWYFRQGNMTLYELYSLCAAVKYFEPKGILEIGTFDGLTTLHLSLNTNEKCIIHTIDLPPEKISVTKFNIDSGDHELIEKKGFESGIRFKDHPNRNKIIQYFADSAKFDYSPLKGKIDLAIIDGSHSYDYIKSDTENVLKIINDNGIILWHDYGNVIDVIEYLNCLNKTMELFRIKETSLVISGKTLKHS
jgi:Methyltransferase domain